MAFSDRIAQRTLATFAYVRISGLPYIFSDHPIPDAWDAGGGTVSLDSETYTWSTTLRMNGQQPGRTELSMKDGRLVSGSLGFTFSARGNAIDPLNDPWLSFLNDKPTRTDTDYASLTADLTASATTSLTADSSTGFDASGVLHLKTEAIAYASHAAGVFSTLTRGRYGSHATYHPATPDSVAEIGAGGGIIADRPLSLKGRFIEVWIATGTKEDGVITPYGATIDSAEDWQPYAGIVTGAQISSDLLSVEVSSARIEQLGAREIATRLPRATAGTDRGSDWQQIAIDDARNVISWALVVRGGSGEEISARLQRDDGTGTTENVPDGVYHYAEVGRFIEWTMNEESSLFSPFVWLTNGADDAGDPSEPRFQVKLTLTSATNTVFKLRIAEDNSLWPALGFKNEVVAEPTANTFRIDAHRNAARFFLPANGRPCLLWIHGLNGPDWVGDTGVDDDNGAAVDSLVKVGDFEVMGFNATPAGQGDLVDTSVVITSRRRLGSRLNEDLYIEWTADSTADDLPECVQGVAFPGVSFLRMLAYLALSDDGTGTNDATYDVLWRGAGAAIPSRFVDVTSLEALDSARTDQRGRSGWAWFESQSFRDAIQPEQLLTQIFLAPDDTGSGFKLRPFELGAVDESATTITVNQDLITSRPARVTLSSPPLIHSIVMRSDYDAAQEKFFRTATYNNVTARASYDGGQSLSVDVRGVVVAGQKSRVLDPLPRLMSRFVSSMFAMFSWPYTLVTLHIASPNGWGWRLGDPVAITHDAIPSERTADRGVSSMLGRIIAVEPRVFYDGRAGGWFQKITVRSMAYGGRRFSTWSPSARVASKASNTEFTLEANRYTAAADGDDVDHFEVGDALRFFYRGSESTAETATISAISGNDIELDAPGITLSPATATIEIEPDDYDSADLQESQRRHLYMSAAGRTLNNGTTDEAAFLWK
jgi:hypothetical protein